MPWFAAHAIMYFKITRPTKGPIPVWENILLVRARNEEFAARAAAKVAKQSEGNSGGQLEMGGRAGSLVFAGIRVVRRLMESNLTSGGEVGYVELTAKNLSAVRALAAGKEAQVTCDHVGLDYSSGSTRRKPANL